MTEHPYSRTDGDLSYAITAEALEGAVAAAAGRVEGVTVADHRVKRPRGRGAEVTVASERVHVRLAVACRYGTVLPAAARAVQAEVAAALSRLTGLVVDTVDVEVVAVTRP